jgi:hypothetical protein
MIRCILNDKRPGNWKPAERERQKISLPHWMWSYIAFYPVGIGGFFLVVMIVCD